MGRAFNWLWIAYTASVVGTWLAFGAFPLIAIRVLGSGPAAVSGLAAAGLAAGALLGLRLGPWVEHRDKRTVMIVADVVRCAALLSVPLAHGLGLLTYAQLVIVSVIGAAANVAFTAASGAFLKQIVAPERLLRANARFESTTWTVIAVGPMLGGAAVGLLGPVITVYANAAGFLLSGLALAAIRPRPGRTAPRPAGSLADGWRFVHDDHRLRALFRNTIAVNALIMATEPLLAVLLLGELGWPAWWYGLAFGLPCLGGLLGAQLVGRFEQRYGRARVLTMAGVLRILTPVGLALVVAGPGGLLLVVAVEFVVITSMGVFNPLLATERLQRVPDDRISRVLTFWTVANSAAIALTTALWGVLADLVGTRTAIGIAGALLLLTPLLFAGDSLTGRKRVLAWRR
ncbi:MFS transporter [Actinoplanes couchii]|uniref:MFS transporter n=1 Tax=Actinoplanes couchii TaxID=403638 RepID=A0ABQ3XPP6_9ACTN|nr:MFS transporter [Actinoplanes couchii]MDR6319133.1 MFS family permease [Actinoplanes couchii]GID60474.1 MFS transporter [Actinoplanes couchii]